MTTPTTAEINPEANKEDVMGMSVSYARDMLNTQSGNYEKVSGLGV
jgi:hypothetical protein